MATTEEIKTDAILSAIPWRCFHCDFVTNDPAEAQVHFGDKDDAEEFKPICKWWDRLSVDERIKTLQDTLKELEAERREVDRQRVHIDGLEYQVESIPEQIKSYKPFRGCNSIYAYWIHSESGKVLTIKEV